MKKNLFTIVLIGIFCLFSFQLSVLADDVGSDCDGAVDEPEGEFYDLEIEGVSVARDKKPLLEDDIDKDAWRRLEIEGVSVARNIKPQMDLEIEGVSVARNTKPQMDLEIEGVSVAKDIKPNVYEVEIEGLDVGY